MTLVVGLWQPRVVGEEQHLPAHLPGLKLKTGHIFYDRFLHAGAQQDDNGGVREADGELQGHPGRAAAEANQADVLCRVKHRLVGFNSLLSKTETCNVNFAGPTSVSSSVSCANQVESLTRRTRLAST